MEDRQAEVDDGGYTYEVCTCGYEVYYHRREKGRKGKSIHVATRPAVAREGPEYILYNIHFSRRQTIAIEPQKHRDREAYYTQSVLDG